MLKITPRNLEEALSHIAASQPNAADIRALLEGFVHFLRKGGAKHAPERFNQVLDLIRDNAELGHALGTLLFTWLEEVHIYPAYIKLGIFSRNGFLRELGQRLYERFMPSYRDFNNLYDVFLSLFRSYHDEAWLYAIGPKPWLELFNLLKTYADTAAVKNATRHNDEERLHALEMLAIWVAAEALEPDFIRLEPKLLEVDSPFVALQREIAKLVDYYRHDACLKPYDTAHVEVMLDQCNAQVARLRRKGTGVGGGSSVKVAHLLERLKQTLKRLKMLLDIQTAPMPEQIGLHSARLFQKLTLAALEEHSTRLLRRQSIRMLALSITEHTSEHGGHYITRNRSEYFAMLRSACGGGVLIALMALLKIQIMRLGLGDFVTAVLAGLNYGIGFMIIHMLHMTVATKQPAMTAASIAEHIGSSDNGRASDTKLARLSIDVARSQSVAVFGNVSVSLSLAVAIAFAIAHYEGMPLLTPEEITYQLKSVQPFSQPTLWYAAIAGLWLFCSGIIAGFFDNRANYLNLKKRLSVQPVLKRLLPARARQWLGAYLHKHYGSLMGNFSFGMLLGLTGYFGRLLHLPLDIRHVAFSSANLGYTAVSGHLDVVSFAVGFIGVLLIGGVNLWVSFSLALWIALRSRGASIDSLPKLLGSIGRQLKAHPLHLIFPVEAATEVIKQSKQEPGKDTPKDVDGIKKK